MKSNRELIQELLIDKIETTDPIPDKVFDEFNYDEVSVIYAFSYIFPCIDDNYNEDRSNLIFEFIENQDIKNDEYHVSIYKCFKNIKCSKNHPKYYKKTMNVVCEFEFYNEDHVAALKLCIIK